MPKPRAFFFDTNANKKPRLLLKIFVRKLPTFALADYHQALAKEAPKSSSLLWSGWEQAAGPESIEGPQVLRRNRRRMEY